MSEHLPFSQWLFLKWNYSHFANWYYTLKYRRQRAKRGYSNYDVADIENWFFNIIPKMLKTLKKQKDNYPELFTEEWFENNKEKCEELGLNKDNFYMILNDRCDEDANNLRIDLNNYNEKKWHELLDRMIFLFEETNEETCSRKNPYEDECIKRIDKCFPFTKKERKKVKKDPPSQEEEGKYKKVWKLYSEESIKIDDYMNQCKKEALEMFVKYLHNLWS